MFCSGSFSLLVAVFVLGSASLYDPFVKLFFSKAFSSTLCMLACLVFFQCVAVLLFVCFKFSSVLVFYQL